MGAFKETPDQRIQFFGLQEKRVMPQVGGKFGVAGPFAITEQGEDDGAILLGWEEPVAGETDDQSFGLHRLKSRLE